MMSFASWLFVGVLAAPPTQTAPMLARLELAAGEVMIDYGQGYKPALSGAALLRNAKVRTGQGARALVRLSDGAALFFRGGSQAEIGQDAVTLTGGEVWLDAPPNERGGNAYKIGEIKIFASDAGLSIRHSGDGGLIYVARGLATAMSPGGRMEVHAGEQAVIPLKGAPKVSAVAYWEDWTGGMADQAIAGGKGQPGSGQIFGVDRQAAPGTAAQTLEIARQSVRVVIREGMAETEVDQTFFNPTDHPVEGWYWFTAPEAASVTGFAVETNGVLVDGEFIERQEAARQYHHAAETGHAPALLEWIDHHTFRARIFPVPAVGARRVVLRYLELLPNNGGMVRYLYPLQSSEPVRIGEFSLSVDLGEEGRAMEITTLADARVEDGGKRVTMRRSGYVPRCDFQMEARSGKRKDPLRLLRFEAGGDAADYMLVRYVPDIDWQKIKQPRGEVVLVVDTSAGSDENSRTLKTNTAQAILRTLSGDDAFAVVALDVRPTVLFPETGLAQATDENVAAALKRLAEHVSGGATDLSAFFDVALARLHGADQPAVIYVGDGVPTSGEIGNAALIAKLRRALASSRARLFTVGAGPYANRVLLTALASAGGGDAFEVHDSSETSSQALRLVAQLKTPTITDFELDLGVGLDEVFDNNNGKVKSGDELVVLARTHQNLPGNIRVKGRLGGQSFSKEYPGKWDRGLAAAFVPRLWAAEYIRRLLASAQEPERVRGKVLQLGISYGLMTPFTSILALESEQAYVSQGIGRRWSPLRGLRLADLDRKTPPRARQALVMTAGNLGTGAGPAQTQPPADPTPSLPRPLAKNSDLEAMAGLAESAAMQPREGMPPRAAGLSAKSAPAAEKPAERQATVPRKAEAPVQIGEARLEQALQVCSDTARRPLMEKLIVWRQRVRTAQGPQELLGRYLAARQACEFNDWYSEASFLLLMQPAIHDEGAARVVLSYFQNEPETQRFLARLILRRTLDPRIVAVVEGVLFGQNINWATVDGDLALIPDPAQRLTKLRQVLARASDDPNGVIRLVRLLVKNKQLDEALLQGRKLRDSGMTTPILARELGDVLAEQKLADEALRTYSEIVEFDPDNQRIRQLLGDVYLAHGWFEPAYRQYQTLTEQASGEPLFWLRLASAAAGAGRVDEALRLERQVASSAGRPGPTDPRRWAQMLSAARLARLLATPLSSSGDPAKVAEGLKTRLKELQLFRGPGTLLLVTWDDFRADLRLSTMKGNTEVASGQGVDAAMVGLSGVLLSPNDSTQMTLRLFSRSPAANHPITLKRQEITWNGSELKTSTKELVLPAGATQIDL